MRLEQAKLDDVRFKKDMLNACGLEDHAESAATI
jgi:hypothetical protein